MVDAMSFSTTAAALQNEINVRAMVVATTTLAEVRFRKPVGMFIYLKTRFHVHRTYASRLSPVDAHKNHLVPVPLQPPRQECGPVRPPPFAASHHHQRPRSKR